MNQKPFIRIQIDGIHPQSCIYITTKSFLKPKDQQRKKLKLQQLAMMDIVAIINMADDEIFYDEIPHLNPTKSEMCEHLFQQAQGAVRLIDDVLKLSKKSIAICCDQTLEKSHFIMVCYMIYNKFNLLTNIQKLESLENKMCQLNFQDNDLTIEHNVNNITYEFYGAQDPKNYRFKINKLQIQEAEKFQQTKLLTNLPFVLRPNVLCYFCNIFEDYNVLPNKEIHQKLNDRYFYVIQDIKEDAAEETNIFLYIVESEFVNPFENLDKTTTIEQIDETIQTLKNLNIQAIINCSDSDQSLKPYGIQYLNIHINFQEQLESSRLFLHFWTKIKKSSVAIYCDSSMQKSIKVLKNYLKILYNWNEQRVQQEIQEQNSQKEIHFPQQFVMRILDTSCLNSQILCVEEKNKIDWNKVYDNESTKQESFYRSRFVQSKSLDNS